MEIIKAQTKKGKIITKDYVLQRKLFINRTQKKITIN